MTFWCLCSAVFFPLDIMLFLGFVFFCKCFVAHKPHFPFECLCEHQSIHYAPSSALCIRRRLLGVCGGSRCGCPISVSLRETEKNISSINQFYFVFPFDLFTSFTKKVFFWKKKKSAQRHSQTTKTITKHQT